MAKRVSMKSLREAAEEQYTDVVILEDDDDPNSAVIAILRHPMRLNDEERKSLGDMDTDKLEDAPLKTLRELVLMLIEDHGVRKSLAEMVGDDLPTWVALLDAYQEAVDLGEALPSDS